MKAQSRRDGFTLIEVIIAVALVAIMAVAIAPPLVQNIKNSKTTRAQSDTQAIGTAILSFYKDVGTWPLQSHDGTWLYRLIGNYQLGGNNIGVPNGTGSVTGSLAWDDASYNMTLNAALIRNADMSGNTLFTKSKNPQSVPGWNGPYLSRVPLDPWGNPFVVNIRWGRDATAGTDRENNDKHNLMILSAGPNGVFETSFSSSIFDEAIGGDDVGFIFHGATSFESGN